jgi:hypothetical protein
MGVARIIVPYPVSSSRTTTFATKAVTMNTAKMDMIASVCNIAIGALILVLPLSPICISGIVVAPNVSRKKIAKETQKTGEES